MFDIKQYKENEYNRLREEFGCIPHQHECEIEMLYGKRGLKEHCPYTKRQLKKECYCQCGSCEHMTYIVF